jgi:hypothetical protein
MNKITVSLTRNARMNHVPLASLGYALNRAGVLNPLVDVTVPIKMVTHSVEDKLIESLVLILAGGRATYQIDWVLRPNKALAQAWGQKQFAQQSTVADTLDAMGDESVGQLRQAFEFMLLKQGRTCRHDFRRGDLILDGDLTGLPASKQAEGSCKGYFAGKKTAMDAKSRESQQSPTTKHWGR